MGESTKQKRDILKRDLKLCTDGQRVVFVRMYGPQEEMMADKFLYNVDAIAAHNIDMVVDKMPAKKLMWARKQVQRSLDKNQEKKL